MKRKILALLLSLAMLLSVGGMVEGTLAVGISVDSTRSSVTLGEVDPVVTPTPEAEPTVEPEVTPEGTPEPTVEPEATPEATPAPTVEPEATPEATPAPEGEAEHIEGCSDDCTAEGCACPCHAAQKTPEEDFASMTDEELYAYVKQLSTDEEIEAFLKQLPEERLNALVAYAQAQEPVVVPETVVFTDAGPFMPPVTVERVLRRYAAKAAAEEPADTGNGLELKKEATANDDGTYTIRMEAYTTGKVITSTKTVPVDIVLVLDQSGSMAYDFNGNSTNTNANRRQYAMKQAVNNFIGKVNEKYTDEADHRMAIVTFGSDASTLQNWTFVDAAGKTTLQGKINGLPTSPSGATNVAAGMSQAEALMGSGYNYKGANTQRQKVVIVFTDGVPTTSTEFDTDVANNAIKSAKTLKDAGATVYTVGIFNGANPDELYGASGFDTNSDGTVDSQWIMDTWGLFPGTDFPEADRPAGNRFLNYLSSNCPEAVSVGLERSTWGLGILHYNITYKITANSPRTDSSYYLTAKDSDSLDTIFQTISENIQSANIDLGSETVVKDTVSPYFDLPANASAVKLYTAAAKADGTFENEEPNPQGVTAKVKDGAVSVTGFDFNANFVSKELKSDNTYGKKLIIEFTVTQKGGFLGGNNVVTNGENSGVYDKEGNKVEAFPLPQVNVPIQNVTVTAADKNVYLLGGLTAAQLKEGATVTVGEGTKAVSLDLSKANENYGLEAWQTAYVNTTVKLYGADGTTEITDLSNLTDDTTYTISVTVAPKTNGAGASGTPATAKSGVNSPAAKINVFKPELTFKDSEVYYGDTISEYTNLTSTRWLHGTTEADTTKMGAAPTLSLTYTPDSNKIASGKVNTKQDIAVDVAVKINGTDVTTYTTFQHTNCDGKQCGVPENGKFWLHVKTCQLTITKTGGTANEPYVFTVYKGDEKYTEVTIVGNGSATIHELPVGTYTIAEDTGWSWRFTPSYSLDKVMLSASSTAGTITCTNAKSLDKWLNGFSQVVANIFGTANTANN